MPRASSACRVYKLFTYAEKALRYVGEPFLYVLELANLNLDGIAGMRSGGSVLEVPQAPMRGHSPASIVRGAGCAELYHEREPVRRYW